MDVRYNQGSGRPRTNSEKHRTGEREERIQKLEIGAVRDRPINIYEVGWLAFSFRGSQHEACTSQAVRCCAVLHCAS